MASVACGTTFFWSSSCGRKNESGRISGTSRETFIERKIECAYICINAFIFISFATIRLLFISSSSFYIYSFMFKMSLSSRLGYRASLPSRRFRRVRHLAEKRLLTLGYPPLTRRPFFAPPSAVHEYTDARFREPAFAPDFAEATSGEKATAGRDEFAGATVARDPVLLRLAAPNYKGHTSPGISGGSRSVRKVWACPAKP